MSDAVSTVRTAAALPPWRLRLLGAVELLDSAGRPVRLPTRAVTLLLARLALAPGRQHAREELVDMLWPDADGEAGRNRLRQALSVLRSLLETPGPGRDAQPVLHADRRAIWLAAGALACDADAFVQALAVGQVGRAASLYLGELLPGYFDEWVLDEKAWQAEIRQRCVLEFAQLIAHWRRNFFEALLSELPNR